MSSYTNNSSSETQQRQLLAPKEIFNKLTGASSSTKKRKPSAAGAISSASSSKKPNAKSTSNYTWNPHLEYKFKPVSNLKDSMNNIFSRKKKRTPSAADGTKPDATNAADASSAVVPRCEELSQQEVNSIRKSHQLFLSTSVGGVASDRYSKQEFLDHVPNPFTHWEQLDLSQNLLRNIRERNYEKPTGVQMQGIPIISNMDKDFVCVSSTGSGKTLTFALSLLKRITPSKLLHSQNKSERKDFYPFRAVIVSPTKVLTTQIYEEFQHFVKGGSWKVRLLSHHAAQKHDSNTTKSNNNSAPRFNDILIATPKRLALAVKEGQVDLSAVEYIIFDEADKLFELGFLEHVDQIISACTNPNIIKCMFSATMPLTVEQMVDSIMNDYIRLVVGKRNIASTTIQQKLEFVGTENGKLTALRDLLLGGVQVPILIFVQSKQRARELHKQLSLLMSDHVFPVDMLHAGQNNTDNMRIVHQFEAGKVWALIATDVAARGIDFKDVSTVINYDFPYDMMTYIHRIGRTGRAGKQGSSLTYVTYSDIKALRTVAEVMRRSGCPVEEWMLKLDKHEEFMEKRKSVPPSRGSILNPKSTKKRDWKRVQASAKKRKRLEKEAASGGRSGSKKRNKR